MESMCVRGGMITPLGIDCSELTGLTTKMERGNWKEVD